MGGVAGIDFSPIDYNLWHVTDYRGGDAGHGVTQADLYDGSRMVPSADNFPIRRRDELLFRAGEYRLPGTTISNQPGAGNFLYTNPGAYYTYDFPGGAHGSLTTNTFSLAGYAPQDKPTFYFTYYLGKGADYDAARVFISNDGANWDRIADLGDGNGSWRQARIGLDGYAGLENLRLRFDFSTAGDMHVGDANSPWVDSEFLAGAYLEILPGMELHDGDQFTVDDVLFEFDLDWEFIIPNVAGATILDGEQIAIEDASGQIVTFEFDKDGSITGDVAVAIGDKDTTLDVANALVTSIRNSVLVGVTLFPKEEEIKIQGAVSITRSAGAAVVLHGNGPGVSPGATSIPVYPADTPADQIALSIGQLFDQVFTTGADAPGLFTSSKVDGSLIRMIGHTVESVAPMAYGTALPYSNELPGDDYRVQGPEVPNRRFHDFVRGQDNYHEGFYVDDLMVGFAERGEMTTDSTNETGFTAVDTQNTILSGRISSGNPPGKRIWDRDSASYPDPFLGHQRPPRRRHYPVGARARRHLARANLQHYRRRQYANVPVPRHGSRRLGILPPAGLTGIPVYFNGSETAGGRRAAPWPPASPA